MSEAILLGQFVLFIIALLGTVTVIATVGMVCLWAIRRVFQRTIVEFTW